MSIGGVGSSSLVAHIEDGDKDRIWHHQRRKHCLSPDLLPEVQQGLWVRACFMFGDPYAAMLSVFSRGLQRRHERSMGFGRPEHRPVLRDDTTLEEYLAGGVDRFFIGDHMDHWLEYSGDQVQILAVKYENLANHIDDVLAFLGCDRPFEVLPRTRRLEDQSEAVRVGLESLYGDLKARVDALPALIRVTES